MSAAATTTLYLRLEPTLKRGIARLAAKQGRPENHVAAEALRAYIEAKKPPRPSRYPRRHPSEHASRF